MNPFHLAFKVKDIASTRKFYIDILKCKEGRSTDNWIDFDFFGHQLSAHVNTDIPPADYCGEVDGIKVPIPHFGCLLDQDTFSFIQHKLEEANVEFIIKPYTRYPGQTGEQLTLFVIDYSGNPLEFKSFINHEEIFLESNKPIT
jgi:extradiol dioxygenase family protein